MDQFMVLCFSGVRVTPNQTAEELRKLFFYQPDWLATSYMVVFSIGNHWRTTKTDTMKFLVADHLWIPGDPERSPKSAILGLSLTFDH